MSADAGTRPDAKLRLQSVGRVFRPKRRRRVVALEDVSLEVQAGEFVCLLGESGCGKSTLLQMVAGLDRPSSGSILVDGQVITGPGNDRTMVFQSPLLFPWLSAFENIALGLEIRGSGPDSKKRVQELISLVGLEGFEASLPRDLSGGMAQRVALARALAPDPRVLLLDEPYSALDMFTRMRLQEELLRIWTARQVTTIFVTHDIDEAVFLANKLVILSPRPGKIARVIHNPLGYPRDRSDPEFNRMKRMVHQEFTIMKHEVLRHATASADTDPTVHVQ
jgi:ABC-type nitrate/sulfonate/bicarbonate transport system ATPase subunit